MDKLVIFIIGPPGSGKGTHCKLLTQIYPEFHHISIGDLVRAKSIIDTEFSKMANQLIKDGKLLPSEIVIQLIKDEMNNNHNKSVFLLDGYPRNKENIECWNTHMSDIIVSLVIVLDCDEETLLKRILGRKENRLDDNVESFKKRMIMYHNETEKIIDELNKWNIVRVDSNGTIDEVHEKIIEILEDYFIIIKN